MLTVVTWVWNGPRNYKPEHANVLRSMLRRHLHVPHRLVCFTDYASGFADDVEAMPLPASVDSLLHMRTPEAGLMPSCYPRLWMFSEEAKCLGERVLLLDVDLLIVRDITPLVEPKDDFVGWRPIKSWGKESRVAGGMYLLTPGTRTQVWDDFTPEGVRAAKKAGFRGSDQAWMSYKLGATAALWPKHCGVYAIGDLRQFGNVPPGDARIIQFCGYRKPWDVTDVSWVKDNYR